MHCYNVTSIGLGLHDKTNLITYLCTRTTFVADKDNSIWAALSNDGNCAAVSPIPHAHIYGLENHRQNATVFLSISDGYNVTNIGLGLHDKTNLITYLCTKCGLLL